MKKDDRVFLGETESAIVIYKVGDLSLPFVVYLPLTDAYLHIKVVSLASSPEFCAIDGTPCFINVLLCFLIVLHD